jgi:hypothetical protein
MEVLSLGVTYTIADNTPRALPSRGCHLFITASTATSADFSNDSAMANAKNSVPATDPVFSPSGATVSAGFIRINGGSATVRPTAR